MLARDEPEFLNLLNVKNSQELGYHWQDTTESAWKLSAKMNNWQFLK